MNRWIFFILWIVTLIVGAFVGTAVPDQFIYITGFIAGTFSFMFLRLFVEKR